ncbi:MAG: hypothetical protein L0228_06395 [Planctomycetes bacterium]|nr:hypothetical protein [Planctomycetota bacterium]
MPRFRPRISLLSALLLMTIAGMALVIVQLWREIGPLRAEVQSLRTELGYLNIEDPTKAQAIQLQTGEMRHWKWRIYLPPGRDYRFCCYSGTLPSEKELRGAAWFDRVQNGGIGTGSSGTMDGGEFTLDAMLEKDGDQWKLVTKSSGGRGGGSDTIYQPSGDWLSSPEHALSSSGMTSRQQTVFEPGEPIMLVKCLKPIITRFAGGYSARSPEGAADGFVMWIEEHNPAPPTGAKAP